MTKQDLKDSLDIFLLENDNEEVSAEQLNNWLKSLIDNSVDENLGDRDQVLSENRNLDYSANTLTMSNVAQMKAMSSELPPLGEGNFDFKMHNSSNDAAGFVMRNTSGVDIFSIHNNGDLKLGPKQNVFGDSRSLTINAQGFPKLKFGTVYTPNDPTAIISLTRRRHVEVGPYNDNTFLFQQDQFTDGNNRPYRFHFVNPSLYYGSAATHGLEAGFMFYRDDPQAANIQYAIKPDNTIEHYAHPTQTSPVRATAIDGYTLQVAETSGVKHPQWILSDLQKVSLFVQELNTNPTTSELALFLEQLGLARLI